MTIRNYKKEDYPLIKSWWDRAKEIAPYPSMMPEESSFVLELEGKPILAITLYLTNSVQIAWIDNLIGNPEITGNKRREATKMLVKYVEDFAREKGYKSTLCFSEKDKLVNYYQTLGYHPTLRNVTTLIKELKCHQ